ncbi:class I SAM-dependent rRNA methyltransferase [Ulvibacter litoralis]|uniref:23S rRNA (Cytosine1962-C5)-methyltransferase n=1 Tax=Ulvibacter litoralis TaxID=227084 RepID=A0A1G7FNG4_9FLAO|nr:class I SAM-dependent rRNA methyltransferase [Ulvibacter litoralis]GHC50428.1 rRNA (guanine-N2)-methyltransferase [Ulvibacter litoralis]SDE77404.1 23S rRNA (cytosine1962-C5)-methyltransferase [Ulvibacter litoralis]
MFFTTQFPEITPDRLAVKLSVTGERNVRSGHPWIFSDSIEKVNKEGASGDIAIIFSHSKNKAIGVGLYDPDSPIRIKMLHHGGGATIDSDFFSEKITAAYALRTELLETKTNSYRLLFGENDGFPGFIADVYDNVLVVKLYSAIWFPYFETILKHLIAVSNVQCVVLRLSRKLQEKEAYGLKDGHVIYGKLENEVVQFIEHGVNFSANVIKGHKTGYFLDHRANRKRVGELSEGKKVLDVFSYAGGFSVHALAGGAKEVTSLDISKQALEIALENGQLNDYSGTHTTITGDAFEEMRALIKAHKTFDVVVIDPPSFAKSQKEIEIAKKKYTQLAQLGTQLTAKKGILVLASCSSRITADVFFEINATVLKQQSRTFTTYLKTQHDVDHPVAFLEGTYLKCGYYRFSD